MEPCRDGNALPLKAIISYDDLPNFDLDEDVLESSSAIDSGTKAAMMGSSPVGLMSPTDLLRSWDLFDEKTPYWSSSTERIFFVPHTHVEKPKMTYQHVSILWATTKH